MTGYAKSLSSLSLAGASLSRRVSGIVVSSVSIILPLLLGIGIGIITEIN